MAVDVQGHRPEEPHETCDSPDAAVSPRDKLQPAAYEPPVLVSGAGHDALALAKLTKVLPSALRGASPIILVNYSTASRNALGVAPAR